MYDPVLVRESKWGVRQNSRAQWTVLAAASDEVARSGTAQMDRASDHKEVG